MTATDPVRVVLVGFGRANQAVLELALTRRWTPIICTAEDLAHIRRGDSPAAAAILELAERHAVPIVATGANPGFVLDVWPLTLTGLAWDVERLRARRIVDVSVFGPRVRRSLGIDLTPDEFRAGIEDGSVVGHAGFPESLRILAERMGRQLDRTEVVSGPLLADGDLSLPDGATVPAGRTAGAEQRATGWWQGEPWLEIAMTLHVAPPAAGLTPTDEVELTGRHPLRVRVEPGCRALLSTAAMLVNGIPQALQAPPGVHRPGDLGIVAPWLAEERPPAGVPRR
jgi:2,4-diaminopentanoate dehydrogenase